jgi:hypothetical protein
MKSRILSLSPSFSKFENILPDELIQTQLKEELEITRDELKKIIKEDQENIKNLCLQQNRIIPFSDFHKPDFVVKMAFYTKQDMSPYDHLLFNYAHWIMCLVTLEVLTYGVIDMSITLKAYYNDYVNGDRPKQKTSFINFVSAYQDLFGSLINIRNVIEQYHDFYVRTCNEIDPNNKEQAIYAYKSDTDHHQLLVAVKGLLLHGNLGRSAAFAVLRSVLEIFITRKLFDPKNSQKYQNNKIEFPKKIIPSPNFICEIIDRLQLGSYFKTDSIKRLYTWQSIVAHRGLLSEEYLTWFVYYIITNEIIVSFNNNLKQYGDQILDEFQNLGFIKIV